MKPIIVPSIIAKNQKELDKRYERIKDYSNKFQLDVMDSKFVKNSSINFNFSMPNKKKKFEAHLMIKNPKKWVEKNS